MESKKPDWRNSKDYEYRGTQYWTETEFFCWEFLKRNHDYRKDWERELAKYLIRKKKPLEDRDRFELSVGVLPDSTKCARKYGLKWLRDPDGNMTYFSFININEPIHLLIYAK